MKSRLKFSVLAGLLAGFVAFSGTAFGQAIGSITGTVQDVSSARIPGVEVTATNTATNIARLSVTDATGTYNFANLAVGPYEVVASLPGFQTARVSDITLGVNAVLRYNLTLEVAAAGQQIEVVMDARDVLAEASSSVGEVLSITQVTELPLVGGDVLDLVNILPGAREGGGGAGNNNDSFAGISSSSINTTRDGLSVSDGRFQNGVFGTTLINPDLVQEVRLILTPVDAEMGRGNGQVQITTRSGTNDYRGSAVWSNRNTALDANTWGNNNDIDPITGLWSPTVPNWENQNQITASYGGPIFPNRTFFFALYDQNIVRARAFVNGTVLTPTARQGIMRYWEDWTPVDADDTATTTGYPSVDFQGNPVPPAFNQGSTTDPFSGNLYCFSVFGDQKWDPATGAMSPFTAADCGYPGAVAILPSQTVLGTSYWDQFRQGPDSTGFIQNFMSYMPAANNFTEGNIDGLNTATHRWIRTAVNNGVNSAAAYGGSGDIERKQFNIKIDHNFNQNHKANFGYTIERDREGTNFSAWPDAPSGLTQRKPWVLTSSFSSTLTPTIVNEGRFGVRKNILNEFEPWENPDADVAAAAQAFLLTGGAGLDGTPLEVVFQPEMFDGASAPFNRGDYNGNATPLYNFGDTLSWTRGVHSFKFGGDLRLTRSNGYNGIPTQPRPRLQGGEGEWPADDIDESLGGLTGLRGTGGGNPESTAKNMLYFFSASINQGNQLYWIDDSTDVANGTWEDFTTLERKIRDQVLNEFAWFVKDDWKVLPSLTLNLGVRWEWYGVPYIGSGFTTTTPGQGDGLFGVGRSGLNGADPFDSYLTTATPPVYLSGYNTSALDCTTGQASGVQGIPASSCDASLLTGVEFVGPNSPNPDKGVYRNDLNNFGPAIGFAWQLPFGQPGSTTLRGGYQVTYGGSGRSGIQADSYLGGAPGATSNAALNFGNLGDPYLDLTDVAAVVPIPPTNPAVPGGDLGFAYSRSGSFTAFDPNYTTPYVQNFTLSLTRQLNRNMTVDVRYVGTQAKKQNGSVDTNLINLYHNPEVMDALNVTRLGGDAPLFDQMFYGINLNSTTRSNIVTGNCTSGGNPAGCFYTAVGTLNADGVPQTGSMHVRRRFPQDLAEGDYEAIANFINSNSGTGGGTSGVLPIPAGITNLGGRILRNGCDRLAAGLATPGETRCFPENWLVSNPQFGGGPTYNTNTGSSNYHSMQAQFTLRPTFGTNLQASYTWAKSMQLPSSDWADPLNRDADYRIAGNHRTHDFRLNGTFQLPIGPGQFLFGNSTGAMARVLEDWRLSWTYQAFSGSPTTIDAVQGAGFSSFDVGLYDNSTADVVGNWTERKGQVEWGEDLGGTVLGGTYFGSGTYQSVTDPQCAAGGPLDVPDQMGFSMIANGSCGLSAVADASGNILLQNPQPGTRGTLGQQTMENPGSWNLNASMSKEFQIDESRTLQFRFDATNVMNHPNPGSPEFTINDSDFGTINGKGNQRRQFQGQLRLSF